LVISGIEAHVRQGVKAQEYQDISSFYNAVERDASVAEMSKLFLSEPLERKLLHTRFFFCSFKLFPKYLLVRFVGNSRTSIIILIDIDYLKVYNDCYRL